MTEHRKASICYRHKEKHSLGRRSYGNHGKCPAHITRELITSPWISLGLQSSVSPELKCLKGKKKKAQLMLMRFSDIWTKGYSVVKYSTCHLHSGDTCFLKAPRPADKCSASWVLCTEHRLDNGWLNDVCRLVQNSVGLKLFSSLFFYEVFLCFGNYTKYFLCIITCSSKTLL
jgi:hypothetical protein